MTYKLKEMMGKVPEPNIQSRKRLVRIRSKQWYEPHVQLKLFGFCPSYNVLSNGINLVKESYPMNPSATWFMWICSEWTNSAPDINHRITWNLAAAKLMTSVSSLKPLMLTMYPIPVDAMVNLNCDGKCQFHSLIFFITD